MKKLRAFVALLSVVLLSAVPFTGTAQAAEPNPPVRADIITESLPLGHFITAVAIQYTTEVDLGGATIPPTAFQVVGTRTSSVTGAATTATRPVLRAYTNDAPEQAATATRGRYLILELGSTGAAAGALQFSGGINNPYALSYAVTQTADVLDSAGQVVLQASPTPVVTSSVITPIVDEFQALSYRSTGGQQLNYRFFSPRAYRDQPNRRTLYPLVVTLHGGGERGANNLTQITGNQIATTFANPRRQATNPSIVLSPQVPAGAAWTTPAVQSALLELVDRTIAQYPVDPDRVYLTGLSLGGIGSFDILPKRPHTFAGAIIIAGAGDVTKAPAMVNQPMWVTHSIDDPTVNYVNGSLAMVNAIEAAGATVVRGEWAGNLPQAENDAQALALRRAAEAVGSHTLFTTYLRGTTPTSPHWSWVPTYLNNAMLDWLFSNVRPSFISVPNRIAELVASGRLSSTAANAVLDRVSRAQSAAQASREAVAIGYLDQALARARNQIKGDADDLAVRAEVVKLLTMLRAEQQFHDDAESMTPAA